MAPTPDAPTRYLRKVLLVNGIGDFAVAAMLLFLPVQLAALLGFSGSDEMVYLSGGWGVAALSFGLLRCFAGRHPNANVCWFTAWFGLFEGGVLATYGLVIVLATSLTFAQVALSTLFALVFAIAYALAFAWRRRA